MLDSATVGLACCILAGPSCLNLVMLRDRRGGTPRFPLSSPKAQAIPFSSSFFFADIDVATTARLLAVGVRQSIKTIGGVSRFRREEQVDSRRLGFVGRSRRS
ncbi:unnamed protein product [Linum trigynum]|uniref:Secreted protein n=1 Tax=Linum trigynum TaxID=586398 RepID=A0AAV2CTR1_9ROSI